MLKVSKVCIKGVCACVESVCECMCVERPLTFKRWSPLWSQMELEHRGCWDQTYPPSDAGKKSRLPHLIARDICDVGVMWFCVCFCVCFCFRVSFSLSFLPVPLSLSSHRFFSECCSSSSSSGQLSLPLAASCRVRDHMDG